MHNIALTWQQASVVAGGLKAMALSLRFAVGAEPAKQPKSGAKAVAARLAPIVNETAVISALYAVWQFAGSAPVFDAAGAFHRGQLIERFQHDIGLPLEHGAQSLLVPHPLWAEAANIYYATMHFGMLFALLAWVFLRHRHEYPRVRLTLIGTTLACLLVQLVPVAPPRLLPGAGYVDTAAQYGQSMYSALAAVGPDQLSAMPSVHVAWAGLVGLVVWRLGRGVWRYAGLAHTIVTVLVVTATANHYWSDGIVALALLAAADLMARRVLRGNEALAPPTPAAVSA